jgi:hypothetical protein
MWFIWFILLFLLPSYPNLKLFKEPSPNLSSQHSLVSIPSVESPETCGLSPDLCCSPVLVNFLLWPCCGCCLLLHERYRDLLRVPWPCLEGAVTCKEVPWPAEGTVALSWGCRVLQGGAVTCHNEPLSILVDAAVYFASSQPQPCLLWGLGFLLLGFQSFLVSWLWWHERSIYRWLEILYRSEPSFNWA